MAMIAIMQTKHVLRNLRSMDVPESILGKTQVVVRANAAVLNYAVMFRVTDTWKCGYGALAGEAALSALEQFCST
jgi:hypothetical protein